MQKLQPSYTFNIISAVVNVSLNISLKLNFKNTHMYHRQGFIQDSHQEGANTVIVKLRG